LNYRRPTSLAILVICLSSGVLAQSAAPKTSAAQTAAHGPEAGDAQQIAAVMKKQFDRPDAPLTVEPVSVQGNYAVAGWVQGNKGGRALLQKDKGTWFIAVCAGDGLKDAKVLQTTGMGADQASALATAVKAAEAKLSKDKLALFASFQGMLKVGPSEAQHGGHAGHGAHAQ